MCQCAVIARAPCILPRSEFALSGLPLFSVLPSSLFLLRVTLCLPRVALLASVLSPCPSLCVGGVGFRVLPIEPNEVAWAAPVGLGSSNKIPVPYKPTSLSTNVSLRLLQISRIRSGYMLRPQPHPLSSVTPPCSSTMLWVRVFVLA